MVTDALLTCNVCGPHASLPPSSFPYGFLCRIQVDLPRRRRRRRRGKRGGIIVRRRMALLRIYYPQHASLPRGTESVHQSTAGQCPFDGPYRCLCPILPGFFSTPARIFSRPRRGGASLHNLRLVCRETQLEKTTSQLKIAFINARSLVNKTFLLNDFFYFASTGFSMYHGDLVKSRRVISIFRTGASRL
ncbi:Eukaryotic translation initiation factor 2-alpha kinase gcn-2 [Labeo rohita]|uniref:Eukaryotic translation initiation factor 2-alpha kinase gcn-2 n=1 Tax=Labeo rohita TaxID=84645 RepID=A0ABQ8MGU4_LABRO|nr:Eukaryotic translation initiation factor 2-alpha kinase gcn-2 [Labeo rohita]